MPITTYSRQINVLTPAISCDGCDKTIHPFKDLNRAVLSCAGGAFPEGYFSLEGVPTNLPGLSVIDADAIFAQFGTDWKRMIVHGKELVFCPECLKK